MMNSLLFVLIQLFTANRTEKMYNNQSNAKNTLSNNADCALIHHVTKLQSNYLMEEQKCWATVEINRT